LSDGIQRDQKSRIRQKTKVLQRKLRAEDSALLPADDEKNFDQMIPFTRARCDRHTQKIERKHLTLRTRIKRLTRKTIWFSNTILMHDTVIGLFIHRDEFGLPI
jgi:IS1 family transposase